MSLHLTRDPDEFAARAELFLAERIDRNVLATVLQSIRTHGGFGPEEPLFATLADDDPYPGHDPGHDPHNDHDLDRAAAPEIAGVAMRTPPWPMLAAGFDDLDAARRLIAAWLERDPEPSGVSATPATAQAIARAYTELTGGTSALEFDEAMLVLSEVIDPPRPAPGSLRQARTEDTDTLVEWERGFNLDARMGDPETAPISVGRRLASGLQYVWTLPDGAPVSTVAHSPAVAGVARIGPVYTPPGHRGHGYASAATATLSRRLLSQGARTVMLFTDLANPTSNKIYVSIGFVRCGDWEQHRLRPPASTA